MNIPNDVKLEIEFEFLIFETYDVNRVWPNLWRNSYLSDRHGRKGIIEIMNLLLFWLFSNGVSILCDCTNLG